MIFHVVKKELKEILRDSRVKFSTIIVLSLLAIALWITTKQYQSTNAQYESAKQNERTAWESQGDKNPHSAAHYGTYAFKPKVPLSLIDQGVDKYTGVSVFLEAHNRHEAQYSDASDETALSRFGVLTPDFILFFIMPLIIILIGYNAFTKEIEGKTISILKSQGIRGWKVVFGKWIAAFTPVFTIVTGLFVVAGIILSSIKDYGVFSWSSLAVLYIVFLLYYAVFTNIVLVISSLVKRSGISLVACLLFWVLACFVSPKVASNIANARFPYPSYQDFSDDIDDEKRQGLDGHNPWSEEAERLKAEVLREYNVDSIHKLPFNFNAYRMQKGEEYQAKIYDKHYDELKEQYLRQTNVYKSFAIISPFLPTRFLSMSIAQTDYDSHWDFTEAAETYRLQTQRFLNGNTEKNAKYGERYVASADTWKDLPKFEYVPSSLSETINRNGLNFMILLIWLGASAGSLFFINKKY